MSVSIKDLSMVPVHNLFYPIPICSLFDYPVRDSGESRLTILTRPRGGGGGGGVSTHRAPAARDDRARVQLESPRLGVPATRRANEFKVCNTSQNTPPTVTGAALCGVALCAAHTRRTSNFYRAW